jgi:hypothetical protein
MAEGRVFHTWLGNFLWCSLQGAYSEEDSPTVLSGPAQDPCPVIQHPRWAADWMYYLLAGDANWCSGVLPNTIFLQGGGVGWVGLGFEFRAWCLQSRCSQSRHSTTWATLPRPFFSGYFGDGVSRTICRGWPQTSILPISASQVARILGVSHQHPAKCSPDWSWTWDPPTSSSDYQHVPPGLAAWASLRQY